METFFGRYKNALVLVAVLLAQVILLAMQVRRPAPNMPDGHNVRLWRYWVAEVITPPERVAHNTGLGIRGIWSGYMNLRHVREQNEALREENDRLRLEQAGLVEDAREGQRLREMLAFQQSYIQKTVPAQVIGTSGTDQAHVIYIDKGYKDGLRPQMPVITPDGIVGKVKNVFPGTAQVLEISDQTSGAGVMLQTTRIRGVLKGNAFGQPQMINISPDDRIKPGEPVVTSGGDQIYPRGLAVGTVEQVVPDPDTSYVNVLIKPAANLARLEEVLVITETSTKMPFGEQKDIMQSEVDALAEKQRAADILSEKLPSIRDENAPENSDETAAPAGATAAVGGDEGDPSRPVRPPAALHPDRYTPGATPAAATLSPAQAPHLNRPAPSVADSQPPARPLSRPLTPPASASVGTAAAPSAGTSGAVAVAHSAAPGSASTNQTPHVAVSAAPSPPIARAPRPSITADGVIVPRSSPAASTSTASVVGSEGSTVAMAHPAARKTITPLLGETSGGILTPAGMGRLVASPHPSGAPHAAGSPGTAVNANGTAVAGASGAAAATHVTATGTPQVDTSTWHFTPAPAGHGAASSGSAARSTPTTAPGTIIHPASAHTATPKTPATSTPATATPKAPAQQTHPAPQGGR